MPDRRATSTGEEEAKDDFVHMRRKFGDPLEIQGWKPLGEIRKKEGLWIGEKVFKFTEKRYLTETEHVRRQKNGKKVQWALKGQLLRNHNLFLKEMVQAWKPRTPRLRDACLNLSLFEYKQSETVLNWSLGVTVQWWCSVIVQFCSLNEESIFYEGKQVTSLEAIYTPNLRA